MAPRLAPALCACIIGSPLAILACSTPVASALARFLPATHWNNASVISGDFTCRGRSETAVLGHTERSIDVAIFREGLNQAPDVLEFSADDRDPSTVRLSIETRSHQGEIMARASGTSPLHGEKTLGGCVGLKLSDGKIDAAHIYWNQTTKQFEVWQN